MNFFKPQLLFTILMTAMLWSCSDDEPGVGNDVFVGSGDIVTEVRTLTSFQSVQASPAIELIITHGQTQSVEVSSDDNLIGRVNTNVSADGLLSIDLEDGSYRNLTLRVNLTVPILTSVESQGSGAIDISGFNDVENLALRSLGSATFAVSGSGEQLAIELLGSANVSAYEFTARNVAISLTGSGDIEVTAEETITGSLLGSGSIRYRGEPAINVNITGSGSVVNAN